MEDGDDVPMHSRYYLRSSVKGRVQKRKTSAYFKTVKKRKAVKTANLKVKTKPSRKQQKRKATRNDIEPRSPYFQVSGNDGTLDDASIATTLPHTCTSEGVGATVPQLPLETTLSSISGRRDTHTHGETTLPPTSEGVDTALPHTPVEATLRHALPPTHAKRHRHLLYPDFHPPASPFHLVQEQLYKEPWKLLVATIFLNKTTGLAAKPILWEFLRQYPTPQLATKADPKELEELFQPLGLHRKRASGIIRFSEEYIDVDWVYPIELYGIGKYGNDSYRIFCTPEWREVRPTDHWLNRYYAWLCEENDYHPTDWKP